MALLFLAGSIAITFINTFNLLSLYQFALLALIIVSSHFFLLKQISRLSECRIMETTLILKNTIFKTQLLPIDQTRIQPVISRDFFTLVKIQFYIDGIYRSALVVTNKKSFNQMKKRQAISRVL
jgi:hypothetical protein